jgi:hypothetical protein
MRIEADGAELTMVCGMGAGSGEPSALSVGLDSAVWGIGAGSGEPSASSVRWLKAGLYIAWLTEHITGSTISRAKKENPLRTAYFFMDESSGAHHEERAVGRAFETKNVLSAEQDQP